MAVNEKKMLLFIRVRWVVEFLPSHISGDNSGQLILKPNVLGLI